MSIAQDGQVDCEQVLNRIHEFLDHELDEASGDEIRQHIADCEPCLDQVDVDSALKALINRVCSGEKAPASLRERCSAESLKAESTKHH